MVSRVALNGARAMKLFKLHRLVAPGTLAVVGLLLVLVPVANAAGSTFTWKGDAKAPGWSAAENWEGGIAPSAGSGPVALVFPWLTGIEGGDCGSSKPTEACYLGLDDVPGLTAESIQIDDGRNYAIFGSCARSRSAPVASRPSRMRRAPGSRAPS